MLASLRKRDPCARPRALLGATREPDGFEGGRLHPLQEAPEAFSRPQRDRGVVESVGDALGEDCAHHCGVQAPVPPATAAHGCLAQRLSAPLWEEAVSWAEAARQRSLAANCKYQAVALAQLGLADSPRASLVFNCALFRGSARLRRATASLPALESRKRVRRRVFFSEHKQQWAPKHACQN